MRRRGGGKLVAVVIESKIVSVESNACREERCEVKLEKGPDLKSYVA